MDKLQQLKYFINTGYAYNCILNALIQGGWNTGSIGADS